jgi:eukaryotic-like serine/threonine-protein kinase
MNHPFISDRYQIQNLLGEGGFASVYRVLDRALQRDVAMKVLKPSAAEESGTRVRFLDEARRLAGLKHPHIVSVYELGAIALGPFFTMELVDGLTLAELVERDGPLPFTQFSTYLTDLAGAVDHLHARGIVHRDLSARNVMLAQDQRILLMDLGVARDLNSTERTHSGAILGTPEAMSPEQVRGQPVGPATDIYALGVLTYRMLGGRPPFRGDAIEIMHAHAYELPPPLRLIRPDLPQRAYEAVDAALEKDPSSRPPSAAAFVSELTGATATDRPTTIQRALLSDDLPAPAIEKRATGLRLRALGITAFIVVLAALAGGSVWRSATRRAQANAAAARENTSRPGGGSGAILASDDFQDLPDFFQTPRQIPHG